MKRRAVLTLPLAGAAVLSGILVWTGLPSTTATNAPPDAGASTPQPATPTASPSADETRVTTPTPTSDPSRKATAASPSQAPPSTATRTATTRPASAEPSARSTAAAADRTAPVPLWRPSRLVVPALGVDAPVVPITARGSVLTPPDDPRVIGWWNATARVGEQGSIVLTGHTVRRGGGALDHLKTLRTGDLVRLTGVGHGQRYRVTSVRDYSKAAFATNAGGIFAQDVAARLVVITCDNYDRRTRDYLSNTVVVATPV